MRRFLISGRLSEKTTATIKGAEAHHLRVVLRLAPGDRVIMVDSTGGQFVAQITGFEGGKVKTRIVSRCKDPEPPPLSITVAQGLLKEKKMDMLVRMLTELGVERFLPVMCSRSVIHLSGRRLEARLQRWQRIGHQAIKQCRRTSCLEIMPVMQFDQALDYAASHQLRLLFWEEERHRPLSGKIMEAGADRIFIMMGPEGGFDRQEARLARQSGFAAAGLGPRILRAETATLAAVTIVQYLWGDMGQNLLDNHRCL